MTATDSASEQPVPLTGRQKRRLRSAGQHLDCTASVGKAGVTGELVANLRRLLERHELIKVRLPTSDARARKQTGADLARQAGAACVEVLGRTVLLYRPNRDLDPADRVHLD